MSNIALIDYGCHSFSFRLAAHLRQEGYPFRYFANGSLESPNLSSLEAWQQEYPELVRVVTCSKPYGKISLRDRLAGELEWASCCIAALEAERPAAILCSCLPLTVIRKIQAWARSSNTRLIYWLQDLQGTAIAELLGKRLGLAGRMFGRVARAVENRALENSRYVITIAREHESLLPAKIRGENRFACLENWANLEQIPVLPAGNKWALRHGLHRTVNIVYSGTLGFKHDLQVFPALASSFRHNPDIRIVIVSSGAAADHLRRLAAAEGFENLVVLPFQPYEDVPQVLASAAVLIAPLDPSAGSFCVPSKILSYLCAARPIVLAIDKQNPAARMLAEANAGMTVLPGDAAAFVRAVSDLIDNRTRRELLGRNARSYAEASFDMDHVVSRFLGILTAAGIDLHRTYSAPEFALGGRASAGAGL
jgi:glycosyltransferase involved in cell wall biosynthesis